MNTETAEDIATRVCASIQEELTATPDPFSEPDAWKNPRVLAVIKVFSRELHDLQRAVESLEDAMSGRNADDE